MKKYYLHVITLILAILLVGFIYQCSEESSAQEREINSSEQSEDEANADENEVSSNPELQTISADTESIKEIAEEVSKDQNTGSSTISWYTNFSSAMQQQSRTNNPVIVSFFSQTCRYCTLMEETTFADPDVINYINNNYIPIRLYSSDMSSTFQFDGETYSPATFFLALGLRGVPSTLFMDKDSEILDVVTGPIDASVFLQILEFLHDECYLNVTFDDYMVDGNCN